MESDTFVITIGVSNLLALGGLIFRAGGIASTVSKHDTSLSSIDVDVQKMSDRINVLGQRIAHLEGVIKKRRTDDISAEGI